jgi:hypothetical protein
MDEGYNTMVLDLYFVIMKKNLLFPLSKWLSLVVAAPPYCTSFVPLVFLYP